MHDLNTELPTRYILILSEERPFPRRAIIIKLRQSSAGSLENEELHAKLTSARIWEYESPQSSLYMATLRLPKGNSNLR